MVVDMLANTYAPRPNEYRCRECSGELILDVDSGEKVCTACGIVNGEVEVMTSLASPSMPSTELGSILGGSASAATAIKRDSTGEGLIDASGRRILQNHELDRLRRLNNLVAGNDSKVRNLRRAMREIRRLTSHLGLGDSVVENAFQIYRKGINKGRLRGRSIAGVAGGAVYLACRDLGIPRFTEEIEKVTENKPKSIRRYSKILQREANITVDAPDPTSSISRIAKQAGLGGVTERRAIQILDELKDSGVLAGKRPVSIAAAALYVAAIQTGEQITKLRIAFAAEVTTITLRKRTSEILQLLEERGEPSPLVGGVTS